MGAIPLVDLRRQYDAIKPEIDAAMQSVVNETAFIMGPYVERFEENFARACGVKFGIGASSGTTALALACLGLGIGPGDEVITVPNTFIATTEAVTQTGAKVVFVDVDEKTHNIDPQKIKPAITKKTKAIIPVHLYGQMADMGPIRELADQYHLKIIEDAAQAHLAEYQGKRAGSVGDVGCFSFYPGKNLGAYGDGGMVVTDDEALAQRIRKLSDHGRVNKYEYDMEGYNYRLDGIQAAILDVKLKYLAGWNESRRRLAAFYDSLLEGTLGVETPYLAPERLHVYHLYVIRLQGRDAIKDALAREGIFAGIHYPLPLHLQKAYEYLGYQKGDFPVAEADCEQILSLPLFPELSEGDARRVIGALKKAVLT